MTSGKISEAMVEAAYDAFTRSFASKPIGCNNTRDDLRAALLASLSLPPPGGAETTKDGLHSCVCLLEVMADNAKERGDDAEWAMMSVMAKNGRRVLDGYHPE